MMLGILRFHDCNMTENNGNIRFKARAARLKRMPDINVTVNIYRED